MDIHHRIIKATYTENHDDINFNELIRKNIDDVVNIKIDDSLSICVFRDSSLLLLGRYTFVFDGIKTTFDRSVGFVEYISGLHDNDQYIRFNDVYIDGYEDPVALQYRLSNLSIRNEYSVSPIIEPYIRSFQLDETDETNDLPAAQHYNSLCSVPLDQNDSINSFSSFGAIVKMDNCDSNWIVYNDTLTYIGTKALFDESEYIKYSEDDNTITFSTLKGTRVFKTNVIF